MRNMYHLISVHIQHSLLSVCEICNLCTFLDKYLSRHYFMINKLRHFTQIYLVVALKHHVVHCSKVLISWRQVCVFHNVLYNSSFLQARCKSIKATHDCIHCSYTKYSTTITWVLYNYSYFLVEHQHWHSISSLLSSEKSDTCFQMSIHIHFHLFFDNTES